MNNSMATGSIHVEFRAQKKKDSHVDLKRKGEPAGNIWSELTAGGESGFSPWLIRGEKRSVPTYREKWKEINPGKREKKRRKEKSGGG